MKAANSILCIGRHRRNQELLSQVLVKAGYGVKVALSDEDLIPTIQQCPISLVLLDVTGFDAKIWQSYHALQSRAIPTFVIAPPQSSHLQVRYGVIQPFLVKPLAVHSLLQLIAHTLRTHHE